jgi:riboflavin synthase alpha subunit
VLICVKVVTSKVSFDISTEKQFLFVSTLYAVKQTPLIAKLSPSDIEDKFFVNIIPFTWDNTIMQYYEEGNMVNIEIDRMALHIEKLINNND